MFCLSVFLSFLVSYSGCSSSPSSSLVAVAGCDGRSDKRELQDMTTALLHAHRCTLKDEPVPVPIPLNTIPDLIVPSHIIVQRCSGLCLNSLGSTCTPKKTKLETHSVVVYVNATPYCTSIELEHHRGPCKCECGLTPGSCNNRQHFLSDTCTCQCLPHLAREKMKCLNSTRGHTWDSDTCQCTCRHKHTCPPGQYFSLDMCGCVQNLYNGKLECSNQTDLTPPVNLYPLLVIIMAVILFLLLITSLSFTISYRWRREANVHRPLEPQTKAYTITLCSNQSLDKAT